MAVDVAFAGEQNEGLGVDLRLLNALQVARYGVEHARAGLGSTGRAEGDEATH